MQNSRSVHDIGGIALLLAALLTIGPFAMDTYLPSLHSIDESLHATPLEVQQNYEIGRASCRERV